jgi:hypothetical protein
MTKETVEPSTAAKKRSRKIIDADHDNRQDIYDSDVERLTERQAEVVAYREMGFSVPGVADEMGVSEGKVKDELDEVARKRAEVLMEVGGSDGIPQHKAYVVAYSELGYEYFVIASRFNRMGILEEYGNDELVKHARQEVEELSQDFDVVITATSTDEIAEDDTPFLTKTV